MPRLGEGTVHVCTFKTGVLSKVAHDLRLRLREHELDVDDGHLRGVFHLRSLVVEGVVEGGELVTTKLSPADCRKIERAVQTEILDVARHPEARIDGEVTSEGALHRVSGSLELRGRRAHLEISGHEENGRVTGSIDLVPSRWGIVPYKALFGAIQLCDRVLVRFDLPMVARE